jgi:hypothetical protein
LGLPSVIPFLRPSFLISYPWPFSLPPGQPFRKHFFNNKKQTTWKA